MGGVFDRLHRDLIVVFIDLTSSSHRDLLVCLDINDGLFLPMDFAFLIACRVFVPTVKALRSRCWTSLLSVSFCGAFATRWLICKAVLLSVAVLETFVYFGLF